MTGTAIFTDIAADPTAAAAELSSFDREILCRQTVRALVQLEKMYEAARRRLQTAKTTEKFVEKNLELPHSRQDAKSRFGTS